MHEAKLAHDLVDKAVLVATSEDADDITSVRVDIGALNHATPASLGSLLQDVSEGTVVAGTEWNITKSEDKAAPEALDVRLISVTIRED